MTIEQLKARAYDLIAFMNQAQQELNAVNNEITKLSEKKEEVVVGDGEQTPKEEPAKE